MSASASEPDFERQVIRGREVRMDYVEKGLCGRRLGNPDADGVEADLEEFERWCTRLAGEGTKKGFSPDAGPCWQHGGERRDDLDRMAVKMSRSAKEKIIGETVLWGGKATVHPALALLDLVQWKSAEVAYWRSIVQEFTAHELTWGVTKSKRGGEDWGETSEAKPAVALQLLHKAERDLADYSAMALRAGVQERMVNLAQAQAEKIKDVIDAIFKDRRIGLAGLDLRVKQEVVADAILSLTRGSRAFQFDLGEATGTVVEPPAVEDDGYRPFEPATGTVIQRPEPKPPWESGS